MQDLEFTALAFHQRRAAFNPIAAVDMGETLHVLDLGGMHMSADHAVDGAAPPAWLGLDAGDGGDTAPGYFPAMVMPSMRRVGQSMP